MQLLVHPELREFATANSRQATAGLVRGAWLLRGAVRHMLAVSHRPLPPVSCQPGSIHPCKGHPRLTTGAINKTFFIHISQLSLRCQGKAWREEKMSRRPRSRNQASGRHARIPLPASSGSHPGDLATDPPAPFQGCRGGAAAAFPGWTPTSFRENPSSRMDSRQAPRRARHRSHPPPG